MLQALLLLSASISSCDSRSLMLVRISSLLCNSRACFSATGAVHSVNIFRLIPLVLLSIFSRPSAQTDINFSVKAPKMRHRDAFSFAGTLDQSRSKKGGSVSFNRCRPIFFRATIRTQMQNEVFVLEITLLALCFCQNQHSSLFSACLHNQTDHIIKRQRFPEVLLAGDETNISLLSYLRRMVWSSNHRSSYTPMDVQGLNCMLHKLDDQFRDYKTYMQSLFDNAKLDSSLAKVHDLFDGVHNVYYAFKRMLEHREPAARRAMRAACADTKHSPHPTLQAVARRVTESPKLFQSIMEGTGYSQTLFNKFASSIIMQVAISAILAPKCIKMVDRSTSDALMKSHEKNIEEQLVAIEAALISANDVLYSMYHTRVPSDLHNALKYITETHFLPQQGVNYIQQQMTEKYPFRAWAILLYKHVRKEATSAHKHDGSSNNWFHIHNERYTVIAHSSDKKHNCSVFGAKLQNKSLRDVYQDKTQFANFANNNGDLGHSISSLKERLLPELPQSYFISIVTYRSDLKVARNFDRQFHFFEHVRPTINGEISKCVLIGWC